MNTGSWFSTSLDLNDCFFFNAGHLTKYFHNMTLIIIGFN
jgi:hypothetical protein